MTNEEKRHPVILGKIRTICGRLPGSAETVSWGHPTFKVGGKTFAVVEMYKSELGLALKVEQSLLDLFLKDSRFFRTPYIGKRGWITLRMEAARLNWREIGELVKGSYHLVQPLKPSKTTATRPRRNSKRQ